MMLLLCILTNFHSVNNVKMSFNQNCINCTIKIQRAWRSILRHKKTDKVIAAATLVKVEINAFENMG